MTMEHFTDMLWWALAAAPFLMGGFGGSQPSPPKLDTKESEKLTRADYQLKEEFTPRLARAAGEASRGEYGGNLEFALRTLADSSIAKRYRSAMPEESRRRQSLLSQLDAAQAASPEYSRLQAALADTSGGALGQSMTREAEARAGNIGGLTPEEERQATQQARAAMAARGMVTGAAGIGAELLNRSQYQRARRAEDLNLISSVGQSNEARRVGYAGQAADLAEQERQRRMALGQNAYNFSLSSNPQMVALGLGSGYANMTQPSMALMGGQNVQPMYSGGQFSSGGMGGAMMGGGMGALSGALSGAAMGSVVPGIGTALGAGIGALAGGATGFMGGSR